MGVFLFLEASQSCGTTYRLGAHCILTGLDNSRVVAVVLTRRGTPATGCPFSHLAASRINPPIMPILDLFSNRNAPEPGDVWIYDKIPPRLRVQVSNIVREALGTTREYVSNDAIA